MKLTKFNAVKQNITAVSPDQNTKRWMISRPQMCLRCQKEKQAKGGSFTFIGSFRKFICKECLGEIAEKNLQKILEQK